MIKHTEKEKRYYIYKFVDCNRFLMYSDYITNVPMEFCTEADAERWVNAYANSKNIEFDYEIVFEERK